MSKKNCVFSKNSMLKGCVFSKLKNCVISKRCQKSCVFSKSSMLEGCVFSKNSYKYLFKKWKVVTILISIFWK